MKTMPTKLKGLIAFFSITMVLNFFSANWIALVVQVSFLVGILKGNEGVRTLMRTMALVTIGFVIFSLVTLAIKNHMSVGAALAGSLNIVFSGLIYWTLGQSDVEEWMLNRSLGQG